MLPDVESDVIEFTELCDATFALAWPLVELVPLLIPSEPVILAGRFTDSDNLFLSLSLRIL